MKDVGEELGITPAAVLWYVRTKAELVGSIVDLALHDLAPPPRMRESWTDDIRRLFESLRMRLLENRRILGTSAFRRVAPIALSRIGFAAGAILREAGFSEQTIPSATRVLLWHTVSRTSLEMALGAVSESPLFVVRRAAAQLSDPDQRLVLEELLDTPSRDDGAFAFTIDALLRGLTRQLETKGPPP